MQNCYERSDPDAFATAKFHEADTGFDTDMEGIPKSGEGYPQVQGIFLGKEKYNNNTSRKLISDPTYRPYTVWQSFLPSNITRTQQ